MIIKKVEVETTTRYVDDGDEDNTFRNGIPKDYLILSLPLPGGKAIYEIHISGDLRKNLEIAAQLTKE